MKLSCKGLTGAAALLAAALGVSLLGPHRAYAAPGGITIPSESDLGVTILSPDPHTPLTGLKPVEISAFYQGSPSNQIVSIELYLDGQKAATKTLDVPETRGVVSFLVDASQLSAGTHRVVIRATAADEEVKSVKGSFQFGAGENAVPLSDQSGSRPDLSAAAPTEAITGSSLAPKLRLIDPSENGKVQGTVTIRVHATDPSGKAPYVSLFIDKTFKTLRNFEPYEFEWDTTTYPNGYHTIEVSGYNDSPNVGHAKTLRLYVNNPGGETQIRHDLLDGVKTVKTAPKKSVGRPLPLRRPDLLMSDTAAPSVHKAPARMASIMPPHIQSTREIVRHLLRGADAL
ncbi:MAG: Ig-like domain-containing protein, partial [Armatimonadota bacterium]|nr:Ig-like domain-containing protein [Armatimonadota bacterium]